MRFVNMVEFGKLKFSKMDPNQFFAGISLSKEQVIRLWCSRGHSNESFRQLFHFVLNATKSWYFFTVDYFVHEVFMGIHSANRWRQDAFWIKLGDV